MVSLGCLAKAGQEQCDNVGLGGPGTGTPDGMDGLSPALYPPCCPDPLQPKLEEQGHRDGLLGVARVRRQLKSL